MLRFIAKLWKRKPYLKLSFRRSVICLARILTNCGIDLDAPVAGFPGSARERWFGSLRGLSQPPPKNDPWLGSFYLDELTSLDDPYRYERW